MRRVGSILGSSEGRLRNGTNGIGMYKEDSRHRRLIKVRASERNTGRVCMEHEGR